MATLSFIKLKAYWCISDPLVHVLQNITTINSCVCKTAM